MQTKIYAIIQIANKKRSLTNDNELNAILDNFFLIGHLTNEYEIINIYQILTKSSILQNNECEEIFFNRCTELNEHD